MTHNLFYASVGAQFLVAAILWEKGNGTFESFTLLIVGAFLILKVVTGGG